jgi:hypothetical protein
VSGENLIYLWSNLLFLSIKLWRLKIESLFSLSELTSPTIGEVWKASRNAFVRDKFSTFKESNRNPNNIAGIEK